MAGKERSDRSSSIVSVVWRSFAVVRMTYDL
jgi:hypothetical protein